jgi:hypothetical protein
MVIELQIILLFKLIFFLYVGSAVFFRYFGASYTSQPFFFGKYTKKYERKISFGAGDRIFFERYGVSRGRDRVNC